MAELSPSTLCVFRRLRPAAAPAVRRRIQSTDASMALFMQDRRDERTRWDTRLSKLEARINKLNAELNAEALSAALASQAHLRKISDLQTDVHKIQNNLTRSIVAEVLRLKANHTNPRLDPGVQAVLNAIGKGAFDTPGVATVSGGLPAVKYAGAQTAVLAKVAAGGGVTPKNIAQALKTLYGELSKHHHGGVAAQIKIRHGEQTMSETVAAMSILLFARTLFDCRLDAVYTDTAGRSTVVSQL